MLPLKMNLNQLVENWQVKNKLNIFKKHLLISVISCIFEPK